MPSRAANRIVTVSTPAASWPVIEAWLSAKWKITKVAIENSTMVGIVSSERSSSRRSLRRTATRHSSVQPLEGGVVEVAGWPEEARHARRAGRARGRPRPGQLCGSWLVSTRVSPAPRPMSGSTSSPAPGSRLARGSSRSSSSGRAGRRGIRPGAGPCRATGRGRARRRGAPCRRGQQLVDAVRAPRRAAGRGRRGSRARSGRGRAAVRARAVRCAPRMAKARCGSGSPSTETSPAWGRSSVARIRSSVDLPAPLWPSTASVAPRGSVSETLPRAVRSPK